MENISNVKSMSLTVDGKETLFELSHYPDKEEADDQLVVKVGDKAYSTSTFRSLYQILMSVSRNGAASEKPTGHAERGLQDDPKRRELSFHSGQHVPDIGESVYGGAEHRRNLHR